MIVRFWLSGIYLIFPMMVFVASAMATNTTSVNLSIKEGGDCYDTRVVVGAGDNTDYIDAWGCDTKATHYDEVVNSYTK